MLARVWVPAVTSLLSSLLLETVAQASTQPLQMPFIAPSPLPHMGGWVEFALPRMPINGRVPLHVSAAPHALTSRVAEFSCHISTAPDVV